MTEESNMSLESDFILSFYKEVSVVDERHQVVLVQHIETKKFYVKKTVSLRSRDIYTALKDGQFSRIPAIHQLIETEDELIVIEEYVSGSSLDEILKEKRFSEEETRNMTAELCRILQPLHRHQPPIIHRDIKPSNLILDHGGRLFLIDFDASKNYDPQKKRDTVLMGTVDYAAPEQYGFQQSDQRTDIYSIGVLMNKMLTGSLPAQEKYRGPLETVIDKCMALDPRDRYASVSLLQKALKRKKTSLSLPGFRGSRLSCRIAALCWYVFITLMAFSMEFFDQNDMPIVRAQLWANRVGIFAVLILWTLYLADYLNFRDVFPIRRQENPALELLRILAGLLLLLLIPAAFTVYLESLIR